MTANEDILLRLTPEERAAMKKTLWEETKVNTLACRACPLAATRTKVVFGDGDPDTKLMFIGEGQEPTKTRRGCPSSAGPDSF